MSNDDDGFGAGLVTAIILGLAVYGTYKVIENITASPEQKLLRDLGKDLKRLDAGTRQIESGDKYGTPVEVDDDDD